MFMGQKFDAFASDICTVDSKSGSAKQTERQRSFLEIWTPVCKKTHHEPAGRQFHRWERIGECWRDAALFREGGLSDIAPLVQVWDVRGPTATPEAGCKDGYVRIGSAPMRDRKKFRGVDFWFAVLDDLRNAVLGFDPVAKVLVFDTSASLGDSLAASTQLMIRHRDGRDEFDAQGAGVCFTGLEVDERTYGLLQLRRDTEIRHAVDVGTLVFPGHPLPHMFGNPGAPEDIRDIVTRCIVASVGNFKRLRLLS